MVEQINNAIGWLKSQPIDGCITGSALLDYFPGQDVDLFVYNEQSLTKVLFAMHYNDLFQILDPLEQWKFDEYINKKQSSLNKLGLITIKFKYNLCVDINIIFKKQSQNAFGVLSTFDMNIIAKAFDIRSQKLLDLSDSPGMAADWNKWNLAFYELDLWKCSRILRQLERCFKYHKRGYNTDKVVLKYIEIIDEMLSYKSVFKSTDFDDRLKNYKGDLEKVKQICNVWLETHEITEEEIILLQEKVKSF